MSWFVHIFGACMKVIDLPFIKEKIKSTFSGQIITVSANQTAVNSASVNNTYIETKFGIIIFYNGPITYVKSENEGEIRRVNGQRQVMLGTTTFGQESDSFWIFIISNHKYNISTIKGLLSIVFNQDIVYKEVFEEDFSLIDNQYGHATKAIKSPSYHGDYKIDNLNEIEKFQHTISEHDHIEQSRIQLSLRWVNDALHSTGIDSFLKLWIAIELLFIRKDGRIHILKKKLRALYDMNDQTEFGKMSIERIYSLRKKIVHSGEIPSISSYIIDYIFLIFRDLFCYEYMRTEEKKALKFLFQNYEVLTKELQQLTK